jgi:VCBS repeat-containing protein
LTGLVLIALTVALAGSAATKPREMRVACALKKNGAMRYVSKASKCVGRRERVVRFARSGPAVAACVVRRRTRGLPPGSVRRVRRATQCAKGRERAIALPAGSAAYFCARRRGGRLRSVRRPSCRKRELPVVVSPATRNRAPVAVADTASTSEDAASTVQVLANDTDADGDPLSIASIDTAGTKGTVVQGAGGTARYDPAGRFEVLAPGATESDRFSYKADDGRADSAAATVTVTVTGVNDPPRLSGVETGALDYLAGSPAAAVTGGLTVADLDSADLTRATVRIGTGLDSGDDALEFTSQAGITGTYDSGTGVLTLTGTAPKAAYQTALRSVRFTSAGGGDGGPRQLSFEASDAAVASNVVTRTVFVNHPPTDLALSHSKVVEHEPVGNTVGTLSTSDPDPGGSFSYRLVAGAGSTDNDKFAVDGSTVELANDVPAGSYSIRVETNDGHSGTFEKALAIEVVAPNGPPTDITLANADVDENEPVGTAAGTLSTNDPDGGDTHTYSLVPGPGSTDNDKFQVDGSTLKTSVSFDFEAQSSYSVRIRTNDGRFAGSFEKQFAVTINDANDAPTDLTLSNATVPENQPVGTDVGNLTTTDQDPAQTHTYTLPAGAVDNDKFAITAGGTLKTGQGLNFENDSAHVVRVRTTDNGTPAKFYEEEFSIAVVNVNDAPVGDPETYTGVANTGLVHDGPDAGAPPDPTGPQKTVTGNLLQGDTDEDLPAQPLTIVAESGVPSADGGSADIQADGDFVFHPKPGTSCNNNDSFDYTISDGSTTGQGTVTVNFGPDCPWYVDSSLGAAGDGSSRTPYNSLADLDGPGGAGDADSNGHTIFLFEGSGSYSGNLPLESSQRLQSESHGLTAEGGSLTLLPANPGNNPTVQGGVTLGNGNTIQGVDLGGPLTGTTVGNAVMNTTTPGQIVNVAGKAVDIDGGAPNMQFTTVSSSGSATEGLRLANTSGTFNAGAGTIQNATSEDVELDGGSTNFTYGGNVSDTTGVAVRVVNQFSGTKDFNGAVGAAGVTLSSNTGATIRFDGGMALSTGSSNALSAAGGGTLAITGAANTIATTTGTPLSVTNTTIHADDLTFRSISGSGPSTSGIVLNGTGANGGLTVTGNGGSCTGPGGCTGGTIQSAGGAGVSLTSVGGGVSLTRMAVSNGADDGINGSTVNGLTLDNVAVTGNGNANNDFGMEFTQLSGTAALTNDTVSGNFDSGVRVSNSSGAMTMNVNGGTYSNHLNGGQVDGIFVESTGTGSHNLSVLGPITFSNNKDSHVQHVTQPTATSDNDVTVQGATMSSPVGGGTVLGGGITVSEGGPTSGPGTNTDVTIMGNTIQNSVIGAIAVGTSGSVGDQQIANVDATIKGNTIGQTGVAGSGSVQGNGIFVDSNGNSNVRAEIADNSIRQWTNNSGITLDVIDGDAALDATVKNNLLTEPNSAFAGTNTRGMTIQLGTAQAGDAVDVCLDIGHPSTGSLKNQVFGTGENPQPDVRYLHEGPGSVVKLVGYPGPAAPAIGDIASWFQPRNNIGGTPTVTGTATAPGGSTTQNATSCALPAP